MNDRLGLCSLVMALGAFAAGLSGHSIPAGVLALCAEHNLSISQLMLANEAAWRPEAETRAGLLNIWQVMQDCVTAGCRNEGTMPGGLKVRRRAAALHRQLSQNPEASLRDAVDDYQRRLIGAALAEFGGNWSQAARRLGVDRANLQRLVKRLGW